MPHTKYHKEKIEDYVLEIKQILGTLTSLSSSLNGNLGVGNYTPHVAPFETTVTSVSMNGMFLGSPSLPCEKLIPLPPFFLSRLQTSQPVNVWSNASSPRMNSLP